MKACTHIQISRTHPEEAHTKMVQEFHLLALQAWYKNMELREAVLAHRYLSSFATLL